MKGKKRMPTDGAPVAWKSPFAVLKEVELPPTQQRDTIDRPAEALREQATRRGRVDILRQTAHRGGKTVTVITGFVGISTAEQDTLAKEMQQACGVGGTAKEGRIEIQGDKRTEVARILTKAGFRPVMAGG
ncbi:translation initiation factor [Nitrospirales bacterium NOB]|nr:MAG: translation initiation factor 1 [Nitrospira sp. OLB3]MBV6471479.1 hypothetical protein [Nitrospirota bacterium]MCE7966229.1 translation initiation factor [Nitrospira sp. NTP2]MCK6492140.1 translation initiation factor [Nitrospira sp.]MDL1890104.1 translation initiation factor [Nitrospirales bacterium NOB]MEB2339428.1 translation initiation factor [Nitrospirales bacterium]